MGWLRDHKRKRILESPFPPEWEAVLERRMKHWGYLDDDEQQLLRELTQVFIAEKYWEPCGGLELTDDVQVTIAADACLLLLGLDGLEFKDVSSILIYPSTVKTPDAPHASFGSVVESGSQAILGQALQGGPVLLTWDSVREGARHPEKGHNVVYHEFAHKLDMLTGSVDGMPPLATRNQVDDWVRVATEEFQRVQDRSARGERTFLDAYAATNVGEFFAVATEFFFDLPQKMHKERPDLYEMLNGFYRQDPAERERRAHAGAGHAGDGTHNHRKIHPGRRIK